MAGTPDNTATNQEAQDTTSVVDWEKRYKDTQGSYTKSQQELKAVIAERDTLKDLATNNAQKLTTAQTEELEELKYSDPDAWFSKKSQYESQASNEFNASMTEATSKASSEASIQFELSRRGTILDEFNANSETPLTDEQLANDIPPRLTKQLESGEITFEELVVKAHDYINTPKAIKDTKGNLNQPSFDGKGSYAKDNNPKATTSKKYENSVY